MGATSGILYVGMTLIRQLRDDAVDSGKSLADLLRRAIVLASLLRNEELRNWAKNELEGYGPGVEVPPYRRIPAQIYGQFVGSFGRQVNNYRVPIHALKLSPRMLDLLAEEIAFRNGVASLEDMVTVQEGTLNFSMPSEICMLMPQVIEGFHCAALTRRTHTSAVKQVLDSARSRLLDIVLDLSAEFPDITDSEKAVQGVDRTAAASIIHNHIYGNSNIVAAGANFAQNVRQTVETGNIDALMEAVARIGLSAEEQKHLREAIEEDGTPRRGKFGRRVAAWFGRAAQKLLEAGVTAAPGVITDAIAHYYGWK